MKAVILAGGEGTRLHPISLGRPKALLPVFEDTVLSLCLEQLKHAGVHHVWLTLGRQAEQVEAWCDGHTPEGMLLSCRREAHPLGTAGAVRALLDELGDDDVLVICGDVVCGFDFRELMAIHQTRRCIATMVLTRTSAAPEYGMVLLNDQGTVERFVEKPAWNQVISNTVSTGIYLLTRKAIEKIPPGCAWDLSRDLLPLLLDQGEPVGGYLAEGYWRDVGTAENYLECMSDLLSGKGPVAPPAPKVAPGVWSEIPIPPGVQVVPPCWFSRQVTLEEGCLVGPHVVLGPGACVGRRALVQRSILLDGARAEARSTLYGAILCPGAVAGQDSVLNEGSVLGDGAMAGDGSILGEHVAVWPGREVPAGARLSSSLTAAGTGTGLRFGDGGVVRGLVGKDLTPEAFSALGVLLGAAGKAALGWSGGDGAAMLARALGAGLCAGGAMVLANDSFCPAQAAWLGSYYALPLSLFVEQEGARAYLHCFSSKGLPLSEESIRRLEHQLEASAGVRVSAGQVGQWEHLSGTATAYAADAARQVRLSSLPALPVTISVPGESAWDQALSDLLERLGCRVLRRITPGVPSFASAHGGFRLLAWLEDGTPITSERLLTLAALIDLERGSAVAVPSAAPAVIERLAPQGKVLRLGRDKGAEELYASTPWLRDAFFAAGRIAAYMGQTGKSLSQLVEGLPQFSIRRREILLHHGRGELMEAFTGRFRRAEPAGAGVRLPTGSGWVYVAPLIRRPAVQILAEGADAETAEELCGFYETEILRLDRGGEN